MENNSELQNAWEKMQSRVITSTPYDEQSLESIIKKRGAGYFKNAVKYFWASLVLQIIVYALLTHVLIRYYTDSQLRYLALAGILLILPFTIMLMRKFKSFATVNGPSSENGLVSVKNYLLGQKYHLQKFYQFKKSYELLLIPLTLAIAIILICKLYAPGLLTDHLFLLIPIYFIILSAYFMLLNRENQKDFKEPLHKLSSFLTEIDS